jgi:hypothetical protein
MNVMNVMNVIGAEYTQLPVCVLPRRGNSWFYFYTRVAHNRTTGLLPFLSLASLAANRVHSSGREVL